MSPGCTVADWLSVTAIRLTLNQGRSVERPDGSSRRPSLAVVSGAVWEPHRTETASTVMVGAETVTVRVSLGLTTLPCVAVIDVVPAAKADARPVALIDSTLGAEDAHVTVLGRLD